MAQPQDNEAGGETRGQGALSRKERERAARRLLRVANFTRRYARDTDPWRFRFSKWLLRRLYPYATRRRDIRLVMSYDQGQINVGAAEHLEARILFYGHHEKEIAQLIHQIVRPGDVCIDVGANVGAHTLVMAFATGATGRVIAIEPQPALVERLLENIALNHLDHVAVVNAALTDKDGTATLHTFEDGADVQGLSSLDTRAGGPSVEVRALTGRTLARVVGLRACRLVKVDCAGHEMVVLRQLAEVIREHRPYVLFHYSLESWGKRGDRIEEAMGLLRACDYRLYVRMGFLLWPLGDDAPRQCIFFAAPQRKAIDLPVAE